MKVYLLKHYALDYYVADNFDSPKSTPYPNRAFRFSTVELATKAKHRMPVPAQWNPVWAEFNDDEITDVEGGLL